MLFKSFWDRINIISVLESLDSFIVSSSITIVITRESESSSDWNNIDDIFRVVTSTVSLKTRRTVSAVRLR